MIKEIGCGILVQCLPNIKERVKDNFEPKHNCFHKYFAGNIVRTAACPARSTHWLSCHNKSNQSFWHI